MTSNNAQAFTGDILGFDIGSARIGVARIHPLVKIGDPLAPIIVKDSNPYQMIDAIVAEYDAEALVFGLPRGLEGNDTDQTRAAQEFVQGYIVARKSSAQLYFIDEAGTSKEADQRLNGSTTISRDSMAACILLEDFVNLVDITPLLIASGTVG